MSTGSTSRSRRASRRSIESSDLPDIKSSPLLVPKRPLIRLESASTSSSASIKLSDIFDRENSTLSQPVSPLTPPCDASTPSHKNATGRVRCGAESSTTTTPKSRGKQTQPTGKLSESASNDTTIKDSRRRPSTMKSGLSMAEKPTPRATGPFLTPPHHATGHRRAVSVPMKPSKREHPVDVDHLPLPGRYESQNSNNDADAGYVAEPVLSSIPLNWDDGLGRFAAPASEDSDGSEGMSSRSFETGSAVVLDALGDDMKGTTSPFIPYTCKKHRPEVRRVVETRQTNDDIRRLILNRDVKQGHATGWVYIAESEEYGPEKLKIGMTKSTPDARIKKLEECDLTLEEVSDRRQNPFSQYGLLEKIIHLELRNYRLKRICCCSRPRKNLVHEPNEWFEVDQEKALRVLEKWRDWILVQRPFDSSGVLTPHWRLRTQELRDSVGDVDWDSWTQPPAWCYYVFLIKAHFALTRKDMFFYGISAVVTILSFIGHGRKGVLCAVMFLLLL